MYDVDLQLRYRTNDFNFRSNASPVGIIDVVTLAVSFNRSCTLGTIGVVFSGVLQFVLLQNAVEKI